MADNTVRTHHSLLDALYALFRENPTNWDAVFTGWEALKEQYTDTTCPRCERPFEEIFEYVELCLNSARDHISPEEYLRFCESATRVRHSSVRISFTGSGLIIVEIGGSDDNDFPFGDFRQRWGNTH